MKRKIAAILASDIAGYTRLVSEDEEDTLARFAGYRRAFEDFVNQHGGRVFNTAGDAIMAEFPSAVEATRCAIDIQESMRTRNLGYAPSRQMLFRIGLTIGDVVERDGDLLGDGVNIAARLEGLAEPGGICVSRSIYEQVANKLSVPFRDIGAREVKNLPQPIHAFRIDIRNDGRSGGEPAGFMAQPSRAAKVSDRHAPASIGAGVIMGGLALLTGVSALGVVLWRDFAGPEARIPTPPAQAAPELPKELQAPRTAGIAPAEVKPAEAKPAEVKPASPKPPEEKPVEVAAPAEASKPVEPPKPVEPAKPAEPAKPEEAVRPVEPAPAQRAARPSAEEQAEKLAGLPVQTQPAEPRVEPPAASEPKQAALTPIAPIRPEPAQPSEPAPAPRPALPPGTSPADAFSIFNKSGGVIGDAATAPELFHNARVYEARGEAANARTQYMKLAELGLDFIDPHLRFAALLRAQDGRAGAREIYARLAEGKGGRVAAIVHAMQYEGPERRARLRALTGQHAQYGPVFMVLADELSPERAGAETINERRAQLAALEKFLEADKQGALSQHFLDHSVLAEWLDRARARHVSLNQYLKSAKLEPTAQFMHASSGWMAHVWAPEAATKIAWRINAREEFRATGDSQSIDPRTGKPAPNLSFELPLGTGESIVEIRYEDANGEMRGPFAIRFEPRSELVKSQRDILQRFSNTWLSFGRDGPQANLLYFTQLASYRCAITRVTLTFDDSPLPMQLRLPPCDPANPVALPPDFRPYVSMPASAKSVMVEIAYADGSTSEKRKFERK